MRDLATAGRIRTLFHRLGAVARRPVGAYLAGGATAVLLGWREATIDVDVVFEGDDVDGVLRAIPALKEELSLNVELATPAHFIPVAEGWQERSMFELHTGRLAVFHVELVWQALAKVHRGHRQDVDDVDAMLTRGLVTREELAAAFAAVEHELYRFPNVDPASFARAVRAVVRPDDRRAT